MKKLFIFLLLCFNLFGYCQNKNNSDCVFNNDYKKLTSDAIKNYDKSAIPFWNEKEKVAVLNLKNGDQLQLTLGGCYHFVYNAKLNTKINFGNRKEVEKKILWIVKFFFGNEYYEDFRKILKKKSYKLSEKSTLNKKIYDINFSRNEYSNIIYEYFTIKKIEPNSTEIEVSFYEN